MDILRVEGLTKVYEGRISFTALSDVSFQMKKGEFTAVMGPSGSGKSTLLHTISTIDRPTKGEVWIGKQNPHSMKDSELAHFRRTQLGFVFQDFNLVDTLTVGENIMLPMTLEGVSVKEMKERVMAASKLLGIQKLLQKRTYEISGGQAQRTAIARAVIMNPALLLADEPTGNLDSKSTRDVMDLFQRLNREQETTILMVTHDAFVASFCHRVLIIKDGQLYQEIVAGENRIRFQQKIMDAMSLLGGDERDII